MVFYYYVNNGFFVIGNLLVNVSINIYLFFELFGRVSMVEIDYYLCWQVCFVQFFFYFSNVFRVVVRFFIVAQNDMVIVVIVGIYNRRMFLFRYGQEVVRRIGGINGIDSYFNRIVGVIFEVDRIRKF